VSTQLQLTNISVSISTLSAIGGSCGTNERCKKYIENSACVNSVCTCVPKYVPNSANKVCIPGKDKIVCGLNGDVGL